MTPAITLRHGTVADAATLCTFARQVFEETFGPTNNPADMALYMSSAFTTERLAAELADANNTFLLLHLDSVLAGYAKVRREHENPAALNGARSLELERIYSATRYIGQGIGKKLMQACIDLAKDEGYDTVWLGVWEHNPRAIAFYEKWGFEQFDKHPFLLGNDPQTDLLFKKKIT